MELNKRLEDVVLCKAGGKKVEFCRMVGWTPQYLAKLIAGKDFGIQPVKTLLAVFPDLDARWLLLGEGSMFGTTGSEQVRSALHQRISTMLSFEKYLPVMSAHELSIYTQIINGNTSLRFDPETIISMETRLTKQSAEVNDIIKIAMEKSVCRLPKANK